MCNKKKTKQRAQHDAPNKLQIKGKNISSKHEKYCNTIVFHYLEEVETLDDVDAELDVETLNDTKKCNGVRKAA